MEVCYIMEAQNIREQSRGMSLEGSQEFDLHILEARLRTMTAGRGVDTDISLIFRLPSTTRCAGIMRRWRQSI